MRVCFIVGTLGQGGAERQLLYMLRALTECEIEVRALSLTRGEPYEAQIKDLGISIDWVGASQNRFVRLSKIVASLGKDRPDIIQSSHFYTNFYAGAAGRMLGIKSIGAIRSNVRSEMQANGIFGHLHLRTPRTLIANSRSAVGIAINEYSVRSKRLEFLANVVTPDPSIHTSGHSEYVRSAENAFTILFVGRLVAVKRPELFVNLASRLVEELPGQNLRFVMAGDGHLEHEIRSRLQEDPVGKNFTMLGEVADMSEVYRTADLLVMTSSYEGTPNVVLEAMGFGIPVVATRVGGVPEILDDKSGILVHPWDFRGLVDATKLMIVDPQLRRKLGQHGRKFVIENHSSEHLQNNLVRIYEKLLIKPQAL